MKRVMFVGKKNSRRSQMAEGLARTLASGVIEEASSGLEASKVNPTVKVMLDNPEGEPIETFYRVRDEMQERVTLLLTKLGATPKP